MTTTTVTATFDFLQWQPSYTTHKPYEILVPLPATTTPVPRSNLVFEPHTVPVADARGREASFALDSHGFALLRHPAGAAADLKDRAAVAGAYVPEMEAFLRGHLGGDVETFCFDFRLRESIHPDEFCKRTVNLEDGFDPLLPATHPHIDQTTQGAIRRVRRHMGDRADELLKGRIRIINIWRPLAPVRSWPLALCDARTVAPSDLVKCDIVRRRYVGETYFGRFSPEQRWWYLSGMTREEVVLVKVYDSDADVLASRCLHASFLLDETQPPAVRESMELRVLVFGPD
ncbi:hypothetical protein QBC39DRAFT_367498 [Podospora conica]|nr:hypothetical protein QBC39DRAFT_367498 [Schizothecium conicum]